MEIRQLTAADAEVYRDLRLEGLQTNPEAFGASFEEEMDLSIESFASRLKGQGTFTFGAFNQEDLLGVATLVQANKVKLKHKASILPFMFLQKTRIGHRKTTNDRDHQSSKDTRRRRAN